MQELPWSEYNGLWQPLHPEDDRRRLWTPEQVEVYDTFTWRNAVRKTPATFAAAVTKEWENFPHIIYVSDIIAKFIRNELIAPNGKPAKRLFLTMPPRHGKSFLLSQHVPAWHLCLFPDQQVILTTYEARFAAKWGGKSRDIIEAHGAKFGLSLSDNSAAKDRWGLGKPHLGGMITAGMGGPITGEGGGLLIGDDWVKNSDEANSEVWRESAWDWYNTTFKTRREPGAKMLLLMTRWHDDDPMGRLLQRNAGDLVVIHLPALAGDNDPLGRLPGEALCPSRYTAEDLLEEKAADPASFAALYQGDPTPEEGGLFSKSHFRTWERGGDDAYVCQTPEGAAYSVRRDDCRHFITTDLAISEKKRADYTVFALWALTPSRDLLLLSRFRDRIEEAEHLPTLQRFYDDSKRDLGQVKIRLVGIEKATFGLSLIQNGRRGSNMPIRELDADKDKYSRAIPAGSYCKGGKYYMPKHVDWSEEWISEHTAFPAGTHDDCVDNSAYAAQVCETLFRGLKPKKDPWEVEEEGNDPRMQANIDKIAARNSRVRKQRARRGGF